MAPPLILRSLINLKARLRNTYEFGRMEMKDRKSRHPRVRPDLLRRGFLSQKSRIYPLDQYPLDWFLSDWDLCYHLSNVNGHVPKVMFNNKLFYHLALQKKGLGGLLAPLIGLVSPHGYTSYSEFATLNEALAFHKRLLMKPMEGNAGSGIFVMSEGQNFQFKTAHVIEGLVPAHPYGAAIFPGTLNTIRMTAMRDVKTRRFFLLDPIHRFGTSKSVPVDNFSQGGLCSLVDLETGRISAARTQDANAPNFRHLVNHPETGSPIEGVVVPKWEEAKQLVLQVSEKFPDLHVIGWDVAMTEAGVRLIEGNVGTPGFTMIQMYKPVLLDARVRAFMAHYGVISKKRSQRLERMAREGATVRS
jgi:hypothetical protein